MEFKVGDRVKWTSQSGGFTRTKTGEIICVVHPGERPCGWARRCFTDDFAHLTERGFSPSKLGGGFSRKHESYLVAVGAKLYWPRVKHLRLIND